MIKDKILEKGISVTVCTYNGANRLPNTLKHLSNQVINFPMEIILVDNASTDGSKDIADQWWKKNGNSQVEFRSFDQPIPGKSYAQELAYDKAKYEYLIVCDDDNWLKSDYCQLAFEIMESNHKIGALGGWSEADFDSEKPPWFDDFSNLYAVFKQGKNSGDITDKRGCLYGAGMVIRKSHWLELKQTGFNPLLTCRKGDSLSSGGDTEYCFALQLMGYRIWYDERLFFIHQMPEGRLNLEYVRRLKKAMFESDIPLRPYLDLLNGYYVTRRNYINRFIGNMFKGLIPNTRNLIFGSALKKENAKDYFRNLNHLAFHYRTYHEFRNEVYEWYKKTRSTKIDLHS